MKGERQPISIADHQRRISIASTEVVEVIARRREQCVVRSGIRVDI